MRPVAGPRVRARAWVEWDGQALLGPGHARLLEAIELSGSIAAAAAEVGVAYRTAWGWIRRMNAALGRPLVEATHGGAAKGGAVLTRAGRDALAAFQAVAARLDGFVADAQAEVSGILRDRD